MLARLSPVATLVKHHYQICTAATASKRKYLRG